ncbi:MAG TPA: hypothetical protein VFQ42_22485 [Mycobacterium sp.]|nr:hypothetical protein [Mycobacterium sp.]
MSKTTAEIRIGEPRGNFVLVGCEVELLPDGGAHPWRATCETGHIVRAATRTAAVLALLAERLGNAEETWAALGGTDGP